METLYKCYSCNHLWLQLPSIKYVPSHTIECPSCKKLGATKIHDSIQKGLYCFCIPVLSFVKSRIYNHLQYMASQKDEVTSLIESLGYKSELANANYYGVNFRNVSSPTEIIILSFEGKKTNNMFLCLESENIELVKK